MEKRVLSPRCRGCRQKRARKLFAQAAAQFCSHKCASKWVHFPVVTHVWCGKQQDGEPHGWYEEDERCVFCGRDD